MEDDGIMIQIVKDGSDERAIPFRVDFHRNKPNKSSIARFDMRRLDLGGRRLRVSALGMCATRLTSITETHVVEHAPPGENGGIDPRDTQWHEKPPTRVTVRQRGYYGRLFFIENGRLQPNYSIYSPSSD